MKKYHFILGKGQPLPRVYAGTLLTPMRGFKLGMKVAKLISNIISKVEVDFKLIDLIKDTTTDGELTKVAFDKVLHLLFDGLKYFDDDVYMSLVEEVITKSSVHARVDQGVEENINTINDLDRWFGKYPQDLLIFTARVLWENSSPFLPKEFLKEEKTTNSTTPSLLN